VRYPASVSVPGGGTAPEVGARIENLVAPTVRIASADDDSGGDHRLRLLAATSEKDGIRPGPVARVRFDCAYGSAVRPAEFRCETEQVADDAGQLMRPELAKRVSCTVSFAAGRAAPAPSR
jgi:hypothetical protein